MRVQIECDPVAPGRVHVVAVPRGRTSLFVFDRFEQAVQSEPVLHLRYSQTPNDLELARDARQVSRALPASAAVLASARAPDVLELRVVTSTQVESALVRLPMGPDGPTSAAASAATAALLAGDCRDFSGPSPVAIDCQSGAARPSGNGRVRPPRGQFVSGVVLGATGAASLLTGYGLLFARRSAGDDWRDDPTSLSAQDSWLNLGTGVVASGAVGGALLVAAMPLVLPYETRTPWWAWLHGGLGLAAAAGAIASAVTASPRAPESCTVNGPDPNACVERQRDTDRAILLGATAAPLLTVPLVYLLRPDAPKRERALMPSLTAGRTGAAVFVRGRF